MESSTAQEYVFFINNEVKGPLSRRDAEALAASGSLSPDTPCAPAGAEGWEPASKFFSFQGVASAGGAAELAPEKLDSDTTELDPFLRKRIIQLGLATATTIDEFSREQAEAAVRLFEETTKKDKKGKWYGGVGAGLGAALLVFGFGFTSPGEALNKTVAGKFIKDSEAFLNEQKTITLEIQRANSDWNALNNTQLKAPEGERPAKEVFEQRVIIPPDKTSVLVFQADFSKLAEVSSEKPSLVYFKEFPSDIKKEILSQADLVWKFKHPAALTDPLDEAELGASWEVFKREAGALLENFAKANLQSRVVVDDPKAAEFRIDGIRAEHLAALVEVKLAPGEKTAFPVYFPYKSQEIVKFSEPKRHSTTREEALAFEIYTVREKQQAGGTPYGIVTRFQGKEYFLERKTPILFYLAVAREGVDRDSRQWAWVRVEEDIFNKTEVGAKIPTLQLRDYRCNTAPKDSSMTGSLRFKPQPKGGA
jgi:hypothetical protein